MRIRTFTTSAIHELAETQFSAVAGNAKKPALSSHHAGTLRSFRHGDSHSTTIEFAMRIIGLDISKLLAAAVLREHRAGAAASI
jgi:uncharacterized phosphosugar-binding protein